jgi:hypothetical protein
MTGIGVEELEKDEARPDFNRGAGGEPLIPDTDGKVQRYARMSSFGDTLEEKSGLNNWLVAKAMEGAAKDQSILARAIAASPYEDHKSDWTKLRQDAIQAGRGSFKADVGTAVHAMSERWEQESDYDPGGKFTPALEAYSKVQGALGLKSQLIECQIVNDEIRGAGTADRLYELTKPLVTPDGQVLLPGTLVIGDLKTGSSLDFSAPGYAIQLAGYAGGVLYDVVSNVRLPTPSINQRWAIIMHLSVEDCHCEFIWVDLEVGRFGGRLAEEVREWRRAWRRKGGYKASWVDVKVADGSVPVVVEPEPEPEPFSEVRMPGSKSVGSMSKAELIEEGKRLGVEVKPSWNKPEMLATLEQAAGKDVSSLSSDDVATSSEPEPEPEPELEDLDAWLAWCRDRLEAIRKDRVVLDWMQVRWPKGLLPPKAITTIDQAKALDDYLARVESHWQLGFVAGQPVATVEGRSR